MAQQKYKKWLYILALIILVVPFLGIPQVGKTVLLVVSALLLGYIAFLLPEQKHKATEAEEPTYVENENVPSVSQEAKDSESWDEKE